MRFDEFVETHNVTLAPADELDGLVVDVAVPPGWELFESTPGLSVWVWRTDPFVQQFCANAVLTMTRVEANLDSANAFEMLSEWQIHMLSGSRESHRELTSAREGPGALGALGMYVPTEFGPLISISQTRIIPAEHHTSIAQLTVNALSQSPVEWAAVGLSAKPAIAVGPDPVDYCEGG